MLLCLLLFLFHSQFCVALLEASLEAELEVFEESELGLSYASRLYEFDLGNDWRVDRIDFFNPNAVTHFVDGDRARDALASQGEDHALKDLDTLALFSLWRDVLDALVESHRLTGLQFIHADEFGVV